MPIVETGAGQLRGRALTDGAAFLGVPYAAAPRWAPPAAVAPWVGVREALVPGPVAPQPRREIALFTHGEPPAVDEAACLNLNVFTPSLRGSRPVLVWVHGGGFTIGHGSARLYWGEQLARDAEIVVVTINYRLGSLGWLCHPQLASGPAEPAGNWGLLDQVAALRWVQENIAAFGGDPARVTLAGQSAGALSAMDLLVAPPARGLFRRVILQSPPIADAGQSLEVATGWAQALSAAAGAPVESFEPERLRALPADQLVELHERLLLAPQFAGTRGGALPTVEPATLPRSPADLPAASPDVDVLAGHTLDEGTFFFRAPWRTSPPPERIPSIVGRLLHTDAPERALADRGAAALAAGAAADDLSLLVSIATEAMIAGPLRRWARARADGLGEGGRVFRYRVDHPGAGEQLGATHTVEVPLLFRTWADGGAGRRLAGVAPGAGPVAAELVRVWAAFIHGADPGWAPVAPGEHESELGVFGGRRAFAAELEAD